MNNKEPFATSIRIRRVYSFIKSNPDCTRTKISTETHSRINTTKEILQILLFLGVIEKYKTCSSAKNLYRLLK